MRKITLWTLLLVMVSTCAPIFAATATDFYVELLRRGVAEVEAGRDAAAVTPLRLAAFGLVESIEHYETAQVYLVVALDRLNQPDAARDAALRIIAAERVERKFASLALPAPIRAAVMASARKLLPSSDMAVLLTPSASRSTPPSQTSAKPSAEAPKKVAESSSPQVDGKPVATTPAQPAIPPQSSSTTRSPDDSTTPPAPKPAPVQTQTTPTPSSATRPPDDSTTSPAPKPAPVQTQATPTPPSATRRPDEPTTLPRPKPTPARPTLDVPARLAAGERALIAANLAEARKIYRELLDAEGHDHPTWIRIAEGLYRSRDFPGALAAFQHVGTLRPGEEAYRYYIAVALYETGQHEPARRELAGALPYIEITPDVERYRAKIDGSP